VPSAPCLEVGCPYLAEYRGRCKEHSRERERSINRAGKKLYNSKRWQMTRRHKLTKDPICERCGARMATDVHHIQDLALGGAIHSMWNLQSLCGVCHAKETRRRQRVN
jgi:5-methylcytosine-specific restriction endonuclease McrA